MIINNIRAYVLSHSSSAAKLNKHDLADNIRQIKNKRDFSLIGKLSNDPRKNRESIQKLRSKINKRTSKSNDFDLKIKTLSDTYSSVTNELGSCVKKIEAEVNRLKNDLKLSFENIKESKSNISNDLNNKSVLSLQYIASETKDPQLKQYIEELYQTKALINKCAYNIENFEHNPKIRHHMVAPYVTTRENREALSNKSKHEEHFNVISNKITEYLLKERINLHENEVSRLMTQLKHTDSNLTSLSEVHHDIHFDSCLMNAANTLNETNKTLSSLNTLNSNTLVEMQEIYTISNDLNQLIYNSDSSKELEARATSELIEKMPDVVNNTLGKSSFKESSVSQKKVLLRS